MQLKHAAIGPGEALITIICYPKGCKVPSHFGVAGQTEVTAAVARTVSFLLRCAPASRAGSQKLSTDLRLASFKLRFRCLCLFLSVSNLGSTPSPGGRAVYCCNR
jgi:hypothetical protein